MTIYKQPSLTGGMDQSLIEVVASVPSFTIGFLIFIYSVIFIGGSNTQKRFSGYADYPLWSLLSSLSIGLISLLLTVKVGLIDGKILGIVFALIIMSGFWFFLSKGRGEF
jgi:hypothetical protein